MSWLELQRMPARVVQFYAIQLAAESSVAAAQRRAAQRDHSRAGR
ncbi:MAG: hypothetical protein OXG79_09105 [Chloroflexi bacterium]|nr:hypothetical protein [Chloroflexota bacterium]